MLYTRSNMLLKIHVGCMLQEIHVKCMPY